VSKILKRFYIDSEEQGVLRIIARGEGAPFAIFSLVN